MTLFANDISYFQCFASELLQDRPRSSEVSESTLEHRRYRGYEVRLVVERSISARCRQHAAWYTMPPGVTTPKVIRSPHQGHHMV